MPRKKHDPRESFKKCPYCGVSVKSNNYPSHLGKAHPSFLNDLVSQLADELNVPTPRTEVTHDTILLSVPAAYYNRDKTLRVCFPIFITLPLTEQKRIIAHELMHAKQNNPPQRISFPNFGNAAYNLLVERFLELTVAKLDDVWVNDNLPEKYKLDAVFKPGMPYCNNNHFAFEREIWEHIGILYNLAFMALLENQERVNEESKRNLDSALRKHPEIKAFYDFLLERFEKAHRIVTPSERQQFADEALVYFLDLVPLSKMRCDQCPTPCF